MTHLSCKIGTFVLQRWLPLSDAGIDPLSTCLYFAALLPNKVQFLYAHLSSIFLDDKLFLIECIEIGQYERKTHHAKKRLLIQQKNI